MTPAEVFDKLMQLMEEDNGSTFEVTPAQRARGLAVIAAMQARGWNPEATTPDLAPEWEYESDMEVLTQGEWNDVQKVAAAWGGEDLDKLLNEIFGEDV